MILHNNAPSSNPLKESVAMRALTYGYANTRIKAMRSRLFTPKDYDNMISAKNEKELMSMLEKTDYRTDLVNASAYVKNDEVKLIDIALARNFERYFEKLNRVAPKEAEAFLAITTRRYILKNIKTIFLGIHFKKPKDEILPMLMVAGQFKKDFYLSLLELKTAIELADRLEAKSELREYGKIIRKHTQDANIGALMTELDKHYYSTMREMLGAAAITDSRILSLLEAEIDERNVTNLVRALREKTADAEGFDAIEGGRISAKKIRNAFRARNAEDVVKETASHYKIADAENLLKEGGSLVKFEIEFEKALLGESLRALRRSILSLGAVIGFGYMKEAEIKNLRKILFGRRFSLGAEEIRNELIVAA